MMNKKPDNNLIWAVLSAFFCCPVTGVYAIIQATNVDRKWEEGDKLGAIKASESAKKWSIYGVVFTFFCTVLFFTLFCVFLNPRSRGFSV